MNFTQVYPYGKQHNVAKQGGFQLFLIVPIRKIIRILGWTREFSV